MQILQNATVLRLLAQEREASLRRTTLLVAHERTRRPVRRWIGRQLVRYGTRLAAEPKPMRPVRAR